MIIINEVITLGDLNMNISEIRKILLVTLLAFAAVMMLPACSSTEETPPPEEGAAPPPTGTSGDSDMTCDEGDTREECMDDIF